MMERKYGSNRHGFRRFNFAENGKKNLPGEERFAGKLPDGRHRWKFSFILAISIFVNCGFL